MLRTHGGKPPRDVVDFSTPINPLGPPKTLVEIIERLVSERVYVKYPDYDYSDLRGAIASYYDLNVKNVIPLSGAAEGLSLLLLVLRPKHLITVEPTFGDHRLAANAMRISLITIPYALEDVKFKLDPESICGLPQELRRNSLVMLSNPNNPSGSLTCRDVIEELVGCLGEDSFLLVDEAFSDFTGDSESLLGTDLNNIIILRSFTKIMAVPGLRIGFMYTPNTTVCSLINNVRQPWNVNIIASEALKQLLLEKSLLKRFIRETISVVEIEREFLKYNMRALGLQVYDSKAPFLLVRHPKPHPSFNDELIRRGVYVRDASSFTYLTPHHSRVSVRLRNDNLKLLEALRDVTRNY